MDSFQHHRDVRCGVRVAAADAHRRYDDRRMRDLRPVSAIGSVRRAFRRHQSKTALRLVLLAVHYIRYDMRGDAIRTIQRALPACLVWYCLVICTGQHSYNVKRQILRHLA